MTGPRPFGVRSRPRPQPSRPARHAITPAPRPPSLTDATTHSGTPGPATVGWDISHRGDTVAGSISGQPPAQRPVQPTSLAHPNHRGAAPALRTGAPAGSR